MLQLYKTSTYTSWMIRTLEYGIKKIYRNKDEIKSLKALKEHLKSDVSIA